MRLAILVAALALTGVAAAGVKHAASSTVTGRQLTTGFRKATGDRLVVNTKKGYKGHWAAYDFGFESIATKTRYGTFTVYLVTSADVEADVTDLLADGHTGRLGTPGPGNIYWEQGRTIYGDPFWLAKRRYGQNVVLWWIGSKPVKKTDATFHRLHVALTAVTK